MRFPLVLLAFGMTVFEAFWGSIDRAATWSAAVVVIAALGGRQ